MKKRTEEERIVKTTLRVAHPLWTSARIRALEEGIPVQELVNRAIREYVKKGGRS
jgi:predicted DNA binding CopG/RHH family protein